MRDSGFLLPFRPPAFASWPSFARWGIGRPLRSAYRHEGRTPTGFPRFTRVRYGRGGCPLYPGDCGAHTTGTVSPAAARRISTARSLYPGAAIHHPGLRLTGHHQGFTVIHPSGLPLAGSPRMEQGPLGYSPELQTPPLPATHVEVGTGIEHSPELRHHQMVLQSTQLLTTCDLASHRRKPIPCDDLGMLTWCPFRPWTLSPLSVRFAAV